MPEKRVDHPLPGAPGRVSRLRDMLTECNFLIRLVADQEQLLKGICHLVVDAGGFSRAWVRLSERPAGEAPENAGQNGSRQAQKDYYFCASNPARSSNMAGHPAEPFISLALADERASLGELTLYSSEHEPFDEQETALLNQLAANLAARLAYQPDERRLAPGQLQPAAHPAWRVKPGCEQTAQPGRQPLLSLLNG